MHSADEGGSGSPMGGQFALGGGRVSASAQQKTKHRPTARKHSARPTSFGYDGKTGAGYGIKGGDAHVRTLQSVLNRFGIKDSSGAELADDGRYGPRTTSAVKKLQKAMGLSPTGKVDEAFIKRVSAAHSLADLKPKKVKPVRRSVQYADPGYQDDGQPRYPIDTEDHARLSWDAISRSAGRYEPRDLAKVKLRIKHALAGFGDGAAARSMRVAGILGEPQERMMFSRSYTLGDIQIRRGGDGRTVEAYCAMFDDPYEVRDQYGHYMESIDRSAFNRSLGGLAGSKALCLYNHGMTVHGTPDGMASVPLGKPLEIKPDGKGLLTVTRYNPGPFSDQVLESIRNGDITAQSFRGPIIRSSPSGRVKRNIGGPLPTVTRHELGLVDYGPTPTPVNAGAAIMAVRSAADIYDALQELDADERQELLRALDLAPSTPAADPDDEGLLAEIAEEDASATSDNSEPGAEDPPLQRHSGRREAHKAALKANVKTVEGAIRAKAP